jgi:hypothetical protein
MGHELEPELTPIAGTSVHPRPREKRENTTHPAGRMHVLPASAITLPYTAMDVRFRNAATPSTILGMEPRKTAAQTILAVPER